MNPFLQHARTHSCLALLLGCAAAIPAQTATVPNPFLYADIPDPSIVRVGDRYYMSHTTMHLSPGVPLMESGDLVHWKTIGYVYRTLATSDAMNLANGKSAYGKGSWASSLRHKDGTWYCLVPSYTTGKTHLYSTRDIRTGPWKEVQLPFYHDPSLLFDDDGRNYVVYGGGDIRIIELAADLGSVKAGGLNKVLIPNASSVAGSSFIVQAEGAHIEKIDGWYYVFTITWPNGNGRTALVHRSKTLAGPFEGRIALQDQGVAQGSVVQMKDGSWMGYLFQDRGAVGRVPWLVPVTWKDGWPVFNGGKAPATVTVPSTAAAAGTGFVTSDEFATPTMKPEWQWNHNPDDARWSLTARPGHYRITTARTDADIRTARNSLTQRSFGPKCSGRIALDASGLRDGDVAGLSAFQDSLGYVAIRKDGSALSVVMVRGKTQVASVPLAQNRAYLRVDMDFTNRTDKATFFYSLDGTTWKSIGTTLQMSYTLGMFMGYRYALFAYATKSPGGFADFDWFRIGASAGESLDLYPDTTPVAVAPRPLPDASRLSCAHSRSSLSIAYSVPRAGRAELLLYDGKGRLAARIFDRAVAEGDYELEYGTARFGEGTYLLVARLDGAVLETRRISLLH